MKQFEIPEFYRSPIISKIKAARKEEDKSKKDLAPTVLDFGPVEFLIARHFGFCFGVENAIEIVYRVIQENVGKRIFLLSEMIHNPHVNDDLLSQGVQFIQDTKGEQLIAWDDISAEDIVVIPAFGTTIEIENLLKEKGIEIHKYNTTCPFVERVWKKSTKLGEQSFSIIVHGKPNHEETRATFSHSAKDAPALIIENLKEAEDLVPYLKKEKTTKEFYEQFEGRYSEGFDPALDLERIGVVNQTTILASETQEISDFLQEIITKEYSTEAFADTRDTLCYATLENQNAVTHMLSYEADLAMVVGGYNSSNTSHLVELCEEVLPTFYISSSEKLLSPTRISHFDFHNKKELETTDYLPKKSKTRIVITSGASCPDSMVDQVIQKTLGFFEGVKSIEEVL